MTDHSLQGKCDHRKAQVIAKTEEGDKGLDDFAGRRYPVLHMHCPKCGMFFGREIFSHDNSR